MPPTVARLLPRSLAAAALVGLLACGDSTGPPPPITGGWIAQGIPFVSVTSTTIELRLEQTGQELTGRGSFLHPQGFAADLTVSGITSGDVVVLTLASPALSEPLSYQGLLGARRRTMTGTLSYGQTSEQRTFTREP